MSSSSSNEVAATGATTTTGAAAVAENDNNDSPTSMIRIISPANLQEGFKFEATTPEGRTFLVTVPRGGVKAGEEFDSVLPSVEEEEVVIAINAYPADENRHHPAILGVANENDEPDAVAYPMDTTATALQTISAQEMFMPPPPQPLQVFMDAPDPSGHTGRWRNGLLSCCETLTKQTFWCGCLCPMVVTSQLARRLNLDWRGLESTPESARRTMLILLFIFFFSQIVSSGFDNCYIQLYVILPAFMYNCWLLYRIRLVLRQRYGIMPQQPLTMWQHVGHYLFMIPCSCCASIQMIRHTHDEHKYPYDGFVPDGLPMYAPPIGFQDEM